MKVVLLKLVKEGVFAKRIGVKTAESCRVEVTLQQKKNQTQPC